MMVMRYLKSSCSNKGEPSKGLVGVIHVKGLERLRQYALNNGWRQIAEIQPKPYGVNKKAPSVKRLFIRCLRFLQQAPQYGHMILFMREHYGVEFLPGKLACDE